MLIACVNATEVYDEDEGGCGVTTITPETRSRKAFAAYCREHPDALCLIDPSVRYGYRPPGAPAIVTPRQVADGKAYETLVTNHLRRTWFGVVRYTRTGEISVELK